MAKVVAVVGVVAAGESAENALSRESHAPCAVSGAIVDPKLLTPPLRETPRRSK